MMPDRYRRILLVAIYIEIATILGGIITAFFVPDLFEVILTTTIIFVSNLVMVGYSAFCYVSTKKSNPGKAELDYLTLDRFIIKTDVWFFKRLLMFDHHGKFIGKTTLKINNLKTFLLSFLSHFMIIVPIFYEVKDYNQNLIVKFKREGFRSAVVNIFDVDDRHIGKVEFDELRVLLKFKGNVYVSDDKYRVSSEFLFEDVQSNIMHLDSFSNRVEYHYIFREMSNEVGTFSEPISTDTGKVSLALLNILYYLRAFSN